MDSDAGPKARSRGRSTLKVAERPDGVGPLDMRAAARRRSGSEIPEGAASPIARHRDAVYRRALAVSDIAAALVAITFATGVVGRDRMGIAAMAAMPLVVLVSKAVGLYDRDEYLLRRSTLDEIPALFQVTTGFTLLAWFGERLYIEGPALQKIQILMLWCLLFGLLVAF